MGVGERAGVLHTVECCCVLGRNGLWRNVRRETAAKIKEINPRFNRRLPQLNAVAQDVPVGRKQVIPRIARFERLVRP